MAKTISISGHDYARLAAYGLDDADYGEPQLCNEWPDLDGTGDGSGEWFATIDRHLASDGSRWNVLITGTFANDHSPGASHYTHWELFPEDGTTENESAFKAAVKEWMDKPEEHPDFVYEDDDDDSVDGADHVPDGWDEV